MPYILHQIVFFTPSSADSFGIVSRVSCSLISYYGSFSSLSFKICPFNLNFKMLIKDLRHAKYRASYQKLEARGPPPKKGGGGDELLTSRSLPSIR